MFVFTPCLSLNCPPARAVLCPRTGLTVPGRDNLHIRLNYHNWWQLTAAVSARWPEQSRSDYMLYQIYHYITDIGWFCTNIFYIPLLFKESLGGGGHFSYGLGPKFPRFLFWKSSLGLPDRFWKSKVVEISHNFRESLGGQSALKNLKFKKIPSSI